MRSTFAILLFFSAYVTTSCTPPNIMLEVQPTEDASSVTFPVTMYTDCTLTVPELLAAGMFDENTIIQQTVCTFTPVAGIPLNFTFQSPGGAFTGGPVNAASYVCSLPVPTKPAHFPFTEPIPIS